MFSEISLSVEGFNLKGESVKSPVPSPLMGESVKSPEPFTFNGGEREIHFHDVSVTVCAAQASLTLMSLSFEYVPWLVL